MVDVDQRGVGRLRGVIPLAGRCFAAGVLRRCDDLEVRALELFVKFLPTWQIESAPSPGRPRDEEHFLTAKL